MFHGALSDSFGRRPVVLWGVAIFTLASAGCALSDHMAGVIAPLVMHSTVALAVASLLMMSIGVFAWIWVKPRVA